MKQGKIYNKIIMLVFLAAILAYLGYAVFTALCSPLETVTAIGYEAGLGCHTTGFVARDESVLTSPYAITVVTRAEGERVGVGETVATGYQTSGAQERQSEIESLSSQLEQLQYAYSYGADGADTAALDTDIVADLAAEAKNAARRDMNAYAGVSGELKGLVLRRCTDPKDLSAIQSRISGLQSQLTALKSQSGGDTKSIAAPASGYFSGTADGYETVLTPAALDALTVSGFNSLAPAALPSAAFGRLISGDEWYYVTVVPSTYLEGLKVGSRVDVGFSHDFYGVLSMTISRIGDNENGQRVLVLSCADYLPQATLLRAQTADVTFSSYSGLRVPKDAVRVDKDGASGVYVVESARARWKTDRHSPRQRRELRGEAG
jgi:hypothetical protein